MIIYKTADAKVKTTRLEVSLDIDLIIRLITATANNVFYMPAYEIDELCKRLQAAKILLSSPPGPLAKMFASDGIEISSDKIRDSIFSEPHGITAEAKPVSDYSDPLGPVRPPLPVIITSPAERLETWLGRELYRRRAEITHSDGKWTCTLYWNDRVTACSHADSMETVISLTIPSEDL